MDIQHAYSLEDVIRVWIALVILLSGFLAVFYVLWWGVSLILSWGKEEKIKPAINSIRFAVLWLLLIIVSIFVLPKIWDLLWLWISRYVSPNVIFKEIKQISNKIFDWSNSDSSASSTTTDSSTDVPSNFWDL